MTDRPSREEAMEAAHDAVDPGRLLPGEDPASSLLEDIQHWRAVYRELVEAKTSIIELTRERIAAASASPVRGELSNDETLMLAELERLKRRLRFWQDRAAEHGDR